MHPVCEVAGASVQLTPGAAPALSGIQLAIHRGERVALVGANGSGKSTLLRLLHGLLQPSAGQLVCEPGLRQAMLFQRPHLLRLSVLRNVALGLWLRGSRWERAKERALQVLGEAGLADLAHSNAAHLSTGQLQRVALVRALAIAPQLLLLDEPTASLDPFSKRQVEAQLGTFATRPGMTLVFASHNLGQVKRLASRVVYLEQGRILADLPVDTFFGGRLLESQYPAAYQFVRGELG